MTKKIKNRTKIDLFGESRHDVEMLKEREVGELKHGIEDNEVHVGKSFFFFEKISK